jgi:hypothetical protein
MTGGDFRKALLREGFGREKLLREAEKIADAVRDSRKPEVLQHAGADATTLGAGL